MNVDFQIGLEAGKRGVEIWENPNARLDGCVAAFNGWIAGWCLGRQMREQKEDEQQSQDVSK